jgi:peptide deformylase
MNHYFESEVGTVCMDTAGLVALDEMTRINDQMKSTTDSVASLGEQAVDAAASVEEFKEQAERLMPDVSYELLPAGHPNRFENLKDHVADATAVNITDGSAVSHGAKHTLEACVEAPKVEEVTTAGNFQYDRKFSSDLITTDERTLRYKCSKVNKKQGIEVAQKLWNVLNAYNKRATRSLTRFELDGVDKEGWKDPRPPRAIGLSAPQIRLNARVCVIKCSGKTLCFVNPRITEWSNETVKGYEGCLSVPWANGIVVNRHLNIKVESDNLEPKRFGLEVSGLMLADYLDSPERLLCSCVQHEIAHLHGLLIMDFEKACPTPDTWEEYVPPPETIPVLPAPEEVVEPEPVVEATV